ncbi:MAG: hypothetical protein COA79_15755 [Planctomycetota bacterium]|nr:MAG: hypothetical protein COA79_15755 [Planctomycetota bacterium]
MADNQIKKMTLNKNLAFNFSSTMVSLLIMFIVTPILINNLGAEEYGVYVILGTVIGLLGVMEFGLGEATIYYVAMYHKKNDSESINRVFSAAFWVYFLIGLILLALMLVGSEFILKVLKIDTVKPQEGLWLLRYSLISFMLIFFTSSFISIPQALMRFDVFSYLQIGQNLLRLLVNIVAIMLGTGLAGLLLSNIIVALLYTLFTIIMAYKLLPVLKLQWPTKEGVREVFSYGIFTFLRGLVGMAWRYGDIVLIGFLLGPLYVAFFSIPHQIMMKLLGLLSSAGKVLFSKFSSVESDEVRKKLFLDSTYLLLNLSIIIFVTLSVIFNDFLRLWVSVDFARETYLVAIIIASSSILRGGFISYQAVLQGLGKPKYIFYIALVSSATVLIGDIVLIPMFGLRGAAYALLFAPIWGIIALYLTMSKILKIDKPERLMCLFLVPCLVGLLDMILLFFLRNSYFADTGWIGFLFFSFLCVTILSASMLITSKFTGKFDLIMNFRRVKY